MKAITRMPALRTLTPLLLCGLVGGCATPPVFDAPSPYGARYHEGFAGVRAPARAAIASVAGADWACPRPLDEFWSACLEIVSQYQGIVALDKKDRERTLLVVKGRDAHISPSDRLREVTFCDCREMWLAIAVWEEAGQTHLSLVSMDPITGQLRPAAAVRQALQDQIQAQLNSDENWASRFGRTDGQVRRLPIVSQPSAPQKASARVTSDFGLGEWIGKRLRLEAPAVYCPTMTEFLEVVMQRLKDAARIPDLVARVHVLASPNLDAFALPGGEIYLTAGLIDCAQSIDEIAAVLAHQLDHLKNQDAAKRLHRQQGAADPALRVFEGLLVDATTLGFGLAAGGAMGDSLLDRRAPHPGTVAGSASAQQLGLALAENFSAEIELRADEQGCQTLYAAGFSPEANISLLQTLRQRRLACTTPQKPLTFSSLLDVTPGLDERLQRLKEVLVRLKSGAFNSPQT